VADLSNLVVATVWAGIGGISRLEAYPGPEGDQSFPEESSLLDTAASELQN
jgi:hypothetical protein